MIKVGVIRGGIGSKYEDSLNTGGNVISHLRHDKLNKKYKPIDILIDKSGVWYMGGLPTTMHKIFHSVDVIFNALHGEDNKIHQVLEQWRIPYTGSSPLTSAISSHPNLFKEKLSQIGVKTSRHILFPIFQEDFDGDRETYAIRKAKEIWGRMPPPFIVKSFDNSPSMGIHVCKTFPELVHAIQDGVNNSVSILVEEFIEGRRVSVPVVENFRNKEFYTFPPIEKLGREEKQELENIALLIHSHFNLNHYSQCNFIVKQTPRGYKNEIYIEEVHSHPDLSSESKLHKHLESIGSNMYEFLDHIISQAK